MVGWRCAGDGDPAGQAEDDTAQVDQSADQQGDPQRVPPGPADCGVTSERPADSLADCADEAVSRRWQDVGGSGLDPDSRASAQPAAAGGSPRWGSSSNGVVSCRLQPLRRSRVRAPRPLGLDPSRGRLRLGVSMRVGRGLISRLLGLLHRLFRLRQSPPCSRRPAPGTA